MQSPDHSRARDTEFYAAGSPYYRPRRAPAANLRPRQAPRSIRAPASVRGVLVSRMFLT